MIDRISVEQCTLCGSCYNACPVDAISFKTLYLDFLYPAIDNSRCVGCDRCENLAQYWQISKNRNPAIPLPLPQEAETRKHEEKVVPVECSTSLHPKFYLRAGTFAVRYLTITFM